MTPVISFLPVPTMQALAWTLLHFLWQGAVLALAAAVLMRWVATSAHARYVAGVVMLAVMLATPIGTFLVLQDTMPKAGATASSQTNLAGAQTPARLDVAIDVAGDVAPAPAVSPRVLPAVVLLWLSGVLVLSARLLGGWAVVRRLAATTRQPVSADVEALAALVAERLGLRQLVRIAESSDVSVPIVIGWLKPVVLVPTAAVAGLSPAHLEALLAHELAHVRRRDYLVNLLQSAIETLLFYHPGVWWVSSRVRQEREHCCDDAAVAVCDRFVYVNALTDLAAMTMHTRLALAATDGSLLRRIRRLLANKSDERPGAGWLSIGMVVMFVAALTAAVPALGSGDQRATSVPPPTTITSAAVPAPQAAARSVEVPASEPGIVVPAPEAAVPASTSFAVPSTPQTTTTAEPERRKELTEGTLAFLTQQVIAAESELVGLTRQRRQVDDQRLEIRLRREATAEKLAALQKELQAALVLHERGVAQENVVTTARAQIAAVERELQGIEVESTSMANAVALEERDLQVVTAFYNQLRQKLEAARLAGALERTEASAASTEQSPPPQERKVYTIGGDIRAPRVLTRVDPVYPALAKSARMQGPVHVAAIIGQDGRVREAKAVSGAPFPLLREAAVTAVQQWVYTPTLLNGQPIDVQLSVQVNFKLDTTESSELMAARRQLAEAKAGLSDNHPDVMLLTQQVRELEAAAAAQARLAEAARAIRAQAAAQQPPALPLTDPTTPIRGGDLLVIDIAGEDQLPRWYVVETAGTVRLPLIGRLAVVDRTASQVRDAIARALAERKLADGRAVTVVIHRQR